MYILFKNSTKKNKSIRYLFVRLLQILLIAVVLTSSLKAATQGSLGNTSTGTIEIGVSINRFVVIRGLRDFNFGLWNLGDGTLTDNDNVCIGKNAIGGPYAIRAAGNGNGIDPAAFTLNNGADQINYNVYWNDAPGVAGNVQLTPGVILHGQTGSFFSFLFNLFGFCISNANVQIEIPDTELQVANNGSYSGTLTLLIIPD